MTPENLENLLVAEINALGLPLRAYPQEPGNYFPEHDPGEVLIRYEGRKPIGRDLTGMNSRVKFFIEIVVVTRQVRGAGGAYDTLQQIYDRLEGRTLDGMAGQLTLDAESFLDEKDGLWQFGQKWSVEGNEYQHYFDDYEKHHLGDT